jgi:hypothetical protein
LKHWALPSKEKYRGASLWPSFIGCESSILSKKLWDKVWGYWDNLRMLATGSEPLGTCGRNKDTGNITILLLEYVGVGLQLQIK